MYVFSFEGTVEMISNFIHCAQLDCVAEIRILGCFVFCDRNIHFPEIETPRAGTPKTVWVLVDDKLPEVRRIFPFFDLNFKAPAERLSVNEAEKGDETGHCIVQRVSVVMTKKGRKASGGWWLMTVKVRERAEDGEG